MSNDIEPQNNRVATANPSAERDSCAPAATESAAIQDAEPTTSLASAAAPRAAASGLVAPIAAAKRNRAANINYNSLIAAMRRRLPRGKLADKALIIAASAMLTAAAAIISIGALDALPGQPGARQPAQSATDGANLGNINIAGGGTLSESGAPVGNPALGTPGPVTGPFISGDENAGVEFSTSHIHLIDPASSPVTPTPTPTPNPAREAN